MSPDEERVLWFAPVFCAEGGEYLDLDSMRRGMTQFNDAAKAVADERGTAFVDFDASVPKDLRHFIDTAMREPLRVPRQADRITEGSGASAPRPTGLVPWRRGTVLTKIFSNQRLLKSRRLLADLTDIELKCRVDRLQFKSPSNAICAI